MAIQSMNQGEISTSASIPFYDPSNGADRRASINDLVELIKGQLDSAGGFVTQYASPNATGFTVTTTARTDGVSTWLKITPAGAYAAGTITLPATPMDMQELLVSCRAAVTSLTINGGTVYGSPSTLAANSFFRLKYDGVEATWNRVG